VPPGQSGVQVKGGVRRGSPLVDDVVDGVGAVIFDLDGVLVDTMPVWHEVRIAFAASRDRVWTDEDSEACTGCNSREWAAIMRDRLRLPDPPEIVEQEIVGRLVARYTSEPVPVVPGTPEAVAQIAARLPVAVASSSHPVLIGAALEATGMARHFRVVVSSDEVAAGKPAPDVYLEAARRLGIEPGRCLVVEDSRSGVLAGRAAGMRVVLIPCPNSPPGPGAAAEADLVLPRLADLPLDLPEAPR
jgi:HAD superfamily hydrolase (TIGR01509 family)